MRNKFAATCSRCGHVVLALDGETNLRHGRWITVHDECASSATPPELEGLHGSEYDGEFYGLHGMTQADFRDAMNPDEGDR